MKSTTTIVAWDLHSVVFTEPKRRFLLPARGYECEPLSETVELIQQLHERGIKQVIFSNISKHSFTTLYSLCPDIFSYFDLTASLAEAGFWYRKPFGRYVRTFLQKNSTVKPNNILFFDDKKINVLGARRYGINAQRFITPIAAQVTLQKEGIL